MTVPQVSLSPLDRADGSATYSHGGYTVIAGVNGPVEVQRRDELPEEAAIEVNVRPAIGAGSPKERHLESIIHSTLRHVILVHNHPRTLIQVTLQVLNTAEEEGESSSRKSSSLSVLPALLQASILALLSACIPMSMTFNATSIALTTSGKLVQSPSPKVTAQVSSVHVLAFSSQGDLLLAESEGSFDMDQWEEVFASAKAICCKGEVMENGDAMIDDHAPQSLQSFVETTMAKQAEQSRQWKVSS